MGYNTNGFAHHRIDDALHILAETGYRSVALTLEHDLLDPPSRSGVARCVRRLKPALADLNLCVTIETGSRFILDPRRKHQPTLISAAQDEREKRVGFLRAAIDIAADLSADSVSLWSGAADDDADGDELHDRLAESLSQVLEHAAEAGVRLSFEPEPGMFIDTMARFETLHARLDHPLLGLTLDVGHVHCLADGDLAEHVRRWRRRLWNVHIEDMRRGVHEHLMFGEGEMDLATTMQILKAARYSGPIHVELSRHSHNAVRTCQQAYRFLAPLLP
jgi:sugar phosphate isomerase/epimerase